MSPSADSAKERRDYLRATTVLSADLKSGSGDVQPIYILDLGRRGCRAVMNAKKVPKTVKLRLRLPKGEPVLVMAETRWSKELAPGRFHVGFEMFSFRETGHERRLIEHLNTLTSDASDLDFSALRDMSDDEMEGMSIVMAASRAFNQSEDYDSALKKVLQVTSEALGAERGLFLLNRGGPVPSVEAAHGPEAISQRGLAFSETVVNAVLESGEPLLSMDVPQDEELEEAVSLQVMGTMSVLCVPLQSRGRNFGLLYLDSSVAKGVFEDSDLALATVIADLAASCIERLHYFYEALQREKMTAVATLVRGLVRQLVDPLGTIRTLGESRVRGMGDANDAKKVVNAAKCATALVNDLLRLSGHDKGGFTDICIKEVLARVNATVASHLNEMGIDFAATSQPELPTVVGDEDKLVQIVLNLINNAAAAAGGKEQSKIRVSTAITGDRVRISVADNGVGIPPENLQRIFDPFMTTKKGAQGLGLPIIQSIVNQHDGVIRAQNRPSGGAIFTVELPRKEPDTAQTR